MVTKAITEFFTRKNGKHRHVCKDCMRKIGVLRYEKRKQRGKIQVLEKTCRECNISFPASSFRKHPANIDGLDNICKSCRSEYHQSETMKSYRVERKASGKQKEVLDKYRHIHGTEISLRKKKKRINNPDGVRHKESTYRRDIAKRAITKLGGACTKCGETRMGKLSIDHVDNDGAQERTQIQYQQLTIFIMNEKVDISKYQILCHNHNVEKHLANIRGRIHDDAIGATKKCTRCLKLRSLENFSRDKYKLSGFKGTCKFCERERRQHIKNVVIISFGGKCVECGETNEDFLCIDHINNDGSEKRATNDHQGIWRKLFNGMNKEGLQLLCFNCNAEKEYLLRLTKYEERATKSNF